MFAPQLLEKNMDIISQEDKWRYGCRRFDPHYRDKPEETWPPCNYNEVVLDTQTWVDALPYVVEAVVFDVSGGEEGENRARQVRARDVIARGEPYSRHVMRSRVQMWCGLRAGARRLCSRVRHPAEHAERDGAPPLVRPTATHSAPS